MEIHPTYISPLTKKIVRTPDALNGTKTNPISKFIDLFCGIGGFRIALERCGLNCVFSSDKDKFAQTTYQKNFGELPKGDLTKVYSSDIPSFDILTAGFPCQPFSYAGRNEGFDDKTRGTLFFEIIRILEHHRPKMFLLENVKGLKSHDKGATLQVIEDSLEKLGYTIYWKVLNSYDFGVPQYRERWYCVGFDKNIFYKFPAGSNKGSKLKDIVDPASDNDLKLKFSSFENERIDFHFSSQQVRVQHDSSKYATHTKKGRHGIYSYLKPDGSLRFHVGDFAKTQIQEAYYASLESYAPTIIANRVPKVLELRRKLSVKEAARLQGFPDNFIFPVSDAQAFKQLGNSVTVPVVQAIIHNMLVYYEKSISVSKVEQLGILTKV